MTTDLLLWVLLVLLALNLALCVWLAVRRAPVDAQERDDTVAVGTADLDRHVVALLEQRRPLPPQPHLPRRPA